MRNKQSGFVAEYTQEQNKKIAELEADNKLLMKAVDEWRTKADTELDINAKLHTLTAKLEAENKRLKEELDKLKPKPLLFHSLNDFTVIVNDSVPSRQIWFATKEQIEEALEYSMKQIDQALQQRRGQKA